MKKANLVFVALFLANSGISQTTLFTETFESGNKFTLNTSDLSASTTHNTWVLNNTFTGGSGTYMCPGFTIPYTIDSTPAQPTGITNGPSSNYMHISSQAAINDGINCASYVPAVSACNITSGSNFSQITTSVSTTGYSGIKFKFWWVCAGSSDAYGEVYYSLDNGTNWVSKQSPFNNTSSWTLGSLSDTAWDNQPSILFAFRFVNNTTTSTTSAVPAFSIDDITITADSTFSIPENTSLISSILYPNPTEEDVHIILNKTYKDVTIHISDVSGKTIGVKEFKNTKNLDFKLNSTPGLYFLNIEADAQKLNYKMVKQ